MTRYQIPCKHETGEVPDASTKVDDYHPLTRAEVEQLLEIARSSKDVRETASIQCRLGQGIVGSKCPHEEGPAARRYNALNALFVAQYKSPGSDFVDRICAILEIA